MGRFDKGCEKGRDKGLWRSLSMALTYRFSSPFWTFLENTSKAWTCPESHEIHEINCGSPCRTAFGGGVAALARGFRG
jgi:hypothetical protein